MGNDKKRHCWMATTLLEKLGFIPWLIRALMMFVMDNIAPSFIKRKMIESMPRAKELSEKALENQMNSKIFGGTKMIKSMYETHLIQSRVEVKQGEELPEIDLVEYFDKENTSLKEIMRPGVPLVLNFGSCS